MQKSRRSGCLFVSFGQNVGWRVDKYCRLLLLIPLCNSLPLVVVILAPHVVF